MDDNFTSRAQASTSTTPTAPPTAETLQAIEKLLDDIPPEPLGEWMRQQGYPPETSLLVLPESMRGALPPFGWPRYVLFSPDVSEPVLMRGVLADPRGRYRK